jgi:hypothetical protein
VVERKKVEGYVADGDPGLQVAGESLRYLAGKPVLAGIGLQKTPKQQDQDQQSKENTKRYFEEFPQDESLYVKIARFDGYAKARPALRRKIFAKG